MLTLAAQEVARVQATTIVVALNDKALLCPAYPMTTAATQDPLQAARLVPPEGALIDIEVDMDVT